jgi:hypothetical protein
MNSRSPRARTSSATPPRRSSSSRVGREIPEGAPIDVKGLNITLTYGTTAPVLPTAVAVMKRDVAEGKTAYASADKKRWVSEVYYFPASPGQRDWVVTVNGEAVGKVADWYATLILRNADDATSRIALPDGTTPVIGGGVYQKVQFPAGTYKLVLEVRGKGKVEVPWTKFDKGDVKYLAVVGDVRNGPALPVDALKKALPKINLAWKKFHKQKGVGGGAYNIATPTDPVHVNIDFGKDNVPGGLTRCEVDRIEVQYLADEPETKTTSKSRRPARDKDEPRAIKYSEMYSGAWKVEPWEKAALVDVSEDVRKVVGQASAGRFVIRSTESAPSTWSADGLLQKGDVFEKDYGAFKCDAKKQGELIIVWGELVK